MQGLAFGGIPIGYTYAPSPQQRNLPLLVGILAILIGIVGILVLLVGLFALLVGLGVLGPKYAVLTGSLFGSVVILGVYYFILGIVMVAIARGLWDQEIWALYTLGLVVVLELVGSVLDFDLFLIIVFGLLLVYLVAVREHFS